MLAIWLAVGVLASGGGDLGFVNNTPKTFVYGTPSQPKQNIDTFTCDKASCAKIEAGFTFGFAAGVASDFTLRFWMPKLRRLT